MVAFLEQPNEQNLENTIYFTLPETPLRGIVQQVHEIDEGFSNHESSHPHRVLDYIGLEFYFGCVFYGRVVCEHF